jgi:hypothetical protein
MFRQRPPKNRNTRAARGMSCPLLSEPTQSVALTAGGDDGT